MNVNVLITSLPKHVITTVQRLEKQGLCFLIFPSIFYTSLRTNLYTIETFLYEHIEEKGILCVYISTYCSHTFIKLLYKITAIVKIIFKDKNHINF